MVFPLLKKLSKTSTTRKIFLYRNDVIVSIAHTKSNTTKTKTHGIFCSFRICFVCNHIRIHNNTAILHLYVQWFFFHQREPKTIYRLLRNQLKSDQVIVYFKCVWVDTDINFWMACSDDACASQLKDILALCLIAIYKIKTY